MCLHWGEDWVWPHQHKAQIGGVLQWCLSFCRFLPSPHMIMEFNYSDHQVLGHHSNQSPSPSIELMNDAFRGLSSTTTSVQHPLGWCDGCHRTTAPVRSPHTSYRWRGERDREPIKCMRSPHTSYRWRGERVIEPIKCMLSPHTSYRWRGERES